MKRGFIERTINQTHPTGDFRAGVCVYGDRALAVIIQPHSHTPASISKRSERSPLNKQCVEIFRGTGNVCLT